MRYVAADFGAGSGRIIVGKVDGDKVRMEEIHRFPNRQIRLYGTIYWDFLALFEELKCGLKKAFAKYDDIVSLGVDSWGVDFGLLDKKGRLLSNPVCYRDSRSAGMVEKVLDIVTNRELYLQTGNQLMEINTLFQLYSMVLSNDPLLKMADKLLFTPDLFNYFLSGVAANEYTIASTSQLLHPQDKRWATPLFEQLGLPKHLMQSIIPSGTILGDLLPEMVEEIGGEGVKIIAVGSHDTASAVASIQPSEEGWAFISSGTWSLMGIKVKEPILSTLAMELDFTNEGTVDGEIRFLKNLTGLWLLQNIIREFKEDGVDVDYDTVIEEAERCNFMSVIDTDASCFNNPLSMREAIGNYCVENGLQSPVTPAEYMRSITLSLATKYAEVKKQLEQISGSPISTIYIVGGGSRNRLLNSMTEELTGARVVVGEVEATAIGNILMQHKAYLNYSNQ